MNWYGLMLTHLDGESLTCLDWVGAHIVHKEESEVG